jgi:hypothetical protein
MHPCYYVFPNRLTTILYWAIVYISINLSIINCRNKGDRQQVGLIARKWTGVAEDFGLATDLDRFGLSFPEGIGVQERMRLQKFIQRPIKYVASFIRSTSVIAYLLVYIAFLIFLPILQTKAVLVITCLLVDYLYFEDDTIPSWKNPKTNCKMILAFFVNAFIRIITQP